MPAKRIVDITVGYACNQNCRFCSIAHRRKDLKKTTEDIKNDILLAKKTGARVLGFGGGEPTIRKDIFELVAFAKSQGFETIRIQSNGVMFAYGDFCDKIIAAGANYFKLSIHGHNEHIHDHLTQVPGSFEKAIKGVENLKARDASVEVNTVITRHNFRLLPQIADFFMKKGVSKFCFIFPTAVGNAWDNRADVMPKMSEAAPYLHDAMDLLRESGMDKAIAFNLPYCLMERYKDSLIEENGFNTLVINPEAAEDLDAGARDGKVKSERCAECSYNKKCYGIWGDYARMNGLSELSPMKARTGKQKGRPEQKK